MSAFTGGIVPAGFPSTLQSVGMAEASNLFIIWEDKHCEHLVDNSIVVCLGDIYCPAAFKIKLDRWCLACSDSVSADGLLDLSLAFNAW